MQQYVDLFLIAREAEGCTLPTLRWHRSCLKRFIEWSEEQGISDPDALTPHVVRTYIVTLQQSNLNPTSVATYVRSVRAFFAWLFQEELTEKNVALRVKEPRTPELQKQPFTDSELRALFDACATHRDKAIVSLLIDCGLRANELCTLTRERVLLDQRLLVVMGKGQKHRAVPFSLKTSVILRKHMATADGLDVFCGRSGQPLTPNGLLQLVMRLGKRAGVANVHPHRFRHTYAVSYLRNGGDPLTLQRTLGHTTLHMTNHYVNMATTDLQRSHDNASPLAHLLKRNLRK